MILLVEVICICKGNFLFRRSDELFQRVSFHHFYFLLRLYFLHFQNLQNKVLRVLMVFFLEDY